MSSFAIDYFATIGAENPFEFNDSAVTLEDICLSAITDITIMMPDEMETLVAQDWLVADVYFSDREEFVSMQPQKPTTYPVVVYRRRKQSKRVDHITSIKLVRIRDRLEEGFELVQRSISGAYSANLTGKTVQSPLFFAVKRSPLDFSAFLYGEPIIDDLCCLRPSNPLANRVWTPMPPDDFTTVGISSIMVNNLVSPIDALWAFGVAVRYANPIGLCNIPFKAVTIDRYPRTDNPSTYSLPQEEIPLFAFPHGVRLICPRVFSGESDHTGQMPLPKFFSIIFTNSNGEYFYVACLRFYEKVTSISLSEICNFYQYDGLYEYIQQKEIYAPKIICVISTIPFYKAMRSFLDQIYSLSLTSTKPCAIESAIASLVSIVPLPVHGGRTFHYIIDASIIPSEYQTLPPIAFSLPKPFFFPILDFDFQAPFKCFPISAILVIFSCLLQESRIVFVGSSSQLVTEVMESFRTLLFPLKWTSCYISRLPERLASLVQAPGGFMIGIHLANSKAADANPDFWLNQKDAWVRELQIGSFVIDVMSSVIYECTVNKAKMKEITPVSDARFHELLSLLPLSPRYRLGAKLETARDNGYFGVRRACVRLKTGESKHFTSHLQTADTVDPAMLSDMHTTSASTLQVRDAFLMFLVECIGSYQDYIVPPSNNLSSDVYRMFNEEFLKERYIEESEASMRPLLRKLCATQMFASLIQQRQEGNNGGLVFFEKAGLIYRTFSSKTDAVIPLLYVMVENWKGDSRTALDSCLEACVDFTITENVHAAVTTSAAERSEVLRGNDLNLHVFLAAPLVIPGPASSSVTASSSGDIWPVLSQSLLDNERAAALKRLDPLRKLSMQNVIQAERGLQFYKGFDVILPSGFPSAGVDRQVVSVASASINMLSLRMAKLIRPIGDILQILGIMAQIGRFGLFPLFCESVWRSVFNACSKCGRSGVKLDAITYGLYVKAMSKIVCNYGGSNHIGGSLDTFLHLEEIGYTWYIQQVAVLWLRRKSFSVAPSTSFSSSTRIPNRVDRDLSMRMDLTFEGVDTVQKSLKLIRTSGALSGISLFTSLHCSPTPLSYFIYSELLEFKDEIHNFNDRLDEIQSEALSSALDLYADESIAARSSDSSFRAGKSQSSFWSFSFSSAKTPVIVNSIEEDLKTMYISEIPTDSTPSKSHDLTRLNSFILQSYQSLELNCQGVISISSQSPCPKCGVSLLDEEVASYWALTFKHLRPDELLSQADFKLAHNVTCMYCSTSYFPQLTVQYYTKEKIKPSVTIFPIRRPSFEEPVSSKVVCNWKVCVDYLSPIALNKLIDQLVFYDGELANNKEWMAENRPDLYWNMVWYCTRLGFPSGLHLTSDSEASSGHLIAPVLVNWRTNLGEIIAARILNGDLNKNVTLLNLLGDCPQAKLGELNDYCAKIESYRKYLNGTVEGIASLILSIHPLQEFNRILCCNPKDSQARLTYKTIMILDFLYDNQNWKGYPIDLLLRDDPFLFRDVDQDLIFENTYIKAIECLSADALISIQATKAELLNSICTRDAQRFRFNMGFLF